MFYPAAFRGAARADTVTAVVQISATGHIFERFLIVVGVVCGEKKKKLRNLSALKVETNINIQSPFLK